MKSGILFVFMFAAVFSFQEEPFLELASEHELMSLERRRVNQVDPNAIYYCGLYSYRTREITYEYEFFGVPTRDPIYFMSIATEYEGDEEFEKVVGYTYEGPVQSSSNSTNPNVKDMEILVKRTFVTFYKKPEYTCEEKIELDKEYDATSLHCKNQSGQDPLEFLTKLIGDKVQMEVEFERKMMYYNRKKFLLFDKSGCTSNHVVIEKLL